MTLTLRYRKGAFRSTDNLLPLTGGLWRSRPGATQVARGPVESAVEWDGRLLFQRSGRLWIWDGYEHDLGGAGRSLDAAAFQALTTNAQREDRLYVADGVNPIFYIRRGPDGYTRQSVVNTLLDPQGGPYPIPIASAIEVWRNRLWVAHGDNRIRHSDLEKPHHWDPLFTIELQGGERGSVNSLYAHQSDLVAGTPTGLWAVSGDSQFNFQRTQLLTRGVSGPNGLVSDGQRLFFCSRAGLFTLGTDAPLGADALDAVFEVADSASQLVISPDGRHLLAVIRQRLFCIEIESARIGEIAEAVNGCFRLGSHIGWYGADGIWVCNRRDGYDMPMAAAPRRVNSRVQTWPDTPPRRALLERSFVELRGEADAPVTYTAQVDGRDTTRMMRGADPQPDFTSFWDGALLNWESPPLHHELHVMRSGRSFTHTLACQGHFELISFNPRYRGA